MCEGVQKCNTNTASSGAMSRFERRAIQSINQAMQPSTSRRVPERESERSRGRACERSGSLNLLTYLQSACLVFHPAPSVQRGERLTLSLLSALRRTLLSLSVCGVFLPSLSRALSLVSFATHAQAALLFALHPAAARTPSHSVCASCRLAVSYRSPLAPPLL